MDDWEPEPTAAMEEFNTEARALEETARESWGVEIGVAWHEGEVVVDVPEGLGGYFDTLEHASAWLAKTYGGE